MAPHSTQDAGRQIEGGISIAHINFPFLQTNIPKGVDQGVGLVMKEERRGCQQGSFRNINGPPYFQSVRTTCQK